MVEHMKDVLLSLSILEFNWSTQSQQSFIERNRLHLNDKVMKLVSIHQVQLSPRPSPPMTIAPVTPSTISASDVLDPTEADFEEAGRQPFELTSSR